VVPDLGATNVVVSVWYVKLGEKVYPGDRVVELLLGNATFDIVSDCTGTLMEQNSWPADPVVSGQIVGQLSVNGDG